MRQERFEVAGQLWGEVAPAQLQILMVPLVGIPWNSAEFGVAIMANKLVGVEL